MIKNIIFDMGGVLIDYNPEKTLYGMFDKETADLLLRVIFRNPLWSDKDRGIILPAEISDELTKEVKSIAIKAFEACGCSGVSRVDFLIVNNIPYVLEINTSPGMTDTSDLPAQAQACGICYDELVELILKSAGLNK